MDTDELVRSNAERDEKWDALTGRLKKREDERLDRVRKAKELDEDKGGEHNRAQQFLAEFEERGRALLASLEPPTDSPDGAADTHSFTDDERLERGARELRTLSALAGEAQMILSTYDRKTVNEALSSLQERLTAKQKALVPRSRFAFKKRPAKKVAAESNGIQQPPPPVIHPAPLLLPPEIHPENSIECGLEDAVSAQLSLNADQVDGRDVELRRLTGCRVLISGNPATVHATACVDCRVVLGAVVTSVFVDDCQRTTFQLACQQLRVHRSVDCNFRVHVASRSIVEDCRRLGFGPLGPVYLAQMGQHLARAGLEVSVDAEGRATVDWDRVDDFDWLVAGTASPNWFRLASDDEPTGI